MSGKRLVLLGKRNKGEEEFTIRTEKYTCRRKLIGIAEMSEKRRVVNLTNYFPNHTQQNRNYQK
ncbi:MAG: hypothetical protein ABFQ65_00985 [Nanoarchaeota archaeon]